MLWVEDKNKLKNSDFFTTMVSYLLHHSKYKVGRFIDIYTIDQFIDLLLKANLEEVKYLPKNNLYMFRTYDLGVAYTSQISPARLNEFINLGKVKKDIPIILKYKYCNIFAYIELESIDSKLLLVDDVYFIIKKETKEIYNIFLGKPTNPNYLYHRSDLNNIVITLDKALGIQGFNRIEVSQFPLTKKLKP